MQWDIALELGENTIRLATRENGLAFTAPSLGAMRNDRLIAIGEDALDMLGRAPAGIRVARPLENGRISEPKLAAQWLARLLEPFTTGTKLTRPSVVFVENGFMRQSERELLTGTALELGAGECGALSSDIAAAVGAGLYPSLKDAARGMVHMKRRYEPNPQSAEHYAESYRAWLDCLDGLSGRAFPALAKVRSGVASC